MDFSKLLNAPCADLVFWSGVTGRCAINSTPVDEVVFQQVTPGKTVKDNVWVK